MAVLDELKKQAREARKNLDKLQEAVADAEAAAKMERQLPLRECAELAHNLLCAYNHTDGCAWGHECDNADPWKPGRYSAHVVWLDRVEKTLEESHMSVAEMKRLLVSLSEVTKGRGLLAILKLRRMA